MTGPASPLGDRSSADELVKLERNLIEALARELESTSPSPERQGEVVRQRLDELLAQSPLASEGRVQVRQHVLAELLGCGPIQPLLDDPEISEIMVNAPDNVYVEKGGRLQKTSVVFENHAHIRRIIERIVLPLGRRISESSPTVDARLPDGSRVNAVVPPVGVDGPTITIRKFRKDKLTIEALIEYGSLTAAVAELLRACVVGRLNIVISGGTGSGKTTLLNVLSRFIPETERIVTIEDAAELSLHQDNLVRLETKNAESDGDKAVTVRDLVRNALRMRPDRIVVGECRGGEALDMLQAMNTGHDGSLTTIHANTPRDALARIETMIAMGATNLPERAMRSQIASAIQVVCQQTRLSDGTRRVTSVSEITGMEGDIITMQEIFVFEKMGLSQEGKVLGRFRATGVRPKCAERLKAAGVHLPADMFEGVFEVR